MTPSTLTPDQADQFEWKVRGALQRAHVMSRYLDAPAAPMPKGRPWAYITGAVGSGKTYMAVSMLRGYMEEGAKPLRLSGTPVSTGNQIWDWDIPKAQFTTSMDYLETRKRVVGNEAAAHASLSTKMADFLVIDDLGQESPTQWAVSMLYELINYRYSEELPTIITSQFARNQIARRLAQNGGTEQALAIASRLAEQCSVIDCGPKDRRLGVA